MEKNSAAVLIDCPL